MNIFEITNEDIARLQANWKIWDGLSERDKDILVAVGYDNCVFYSLDKTFKKTVCDDFEGVDVYRIRPDYTLPTPTEAEIIAYLKASEVAPSKWHPVVMKWARKHDNLPIWEYQDSVGKSWGRTSSISTGGDVLYQIIPHRLRADYGKAKEPIIAQPCYKPSDVSYGPFTLEPEVCVWLSTVEGHQKDPHGKGWCFSKEGIQTEKLHCPVCGKRIEVKP